MFRGGVGLYYENSIWNNIEFDRPARLQKGLFLADTTVCTNGGPDTLNLPNGGTVTPSFCGQPVGSVASQIIALQQQYQASTVAAGPAVNPSFIGNPNQLADGLDATGTDLLAPNYVSPRSLQINAGVQHEIRPGMVFSVDYLRNIETHTLLAIDTNHVGDARADLANAQAAISATNQATPGVRRPERRTSVSSSTAQTGASGGNSLTTARRTTAKRWARDRRDLEKSR